MGPVIPSLSMTDLICDAVGGTRVADGPCQSVQHSRHFLAIFPSRALFAVAWATVWLIEHAARATREWPRPGPSAIRESVLLAAEAAHRGGSELERRDRSIVRSI